MSIASHRADRGPRSRWRSAYAVALTNAAVFWLSSAFGSLVAPGLVELQATIAIIFAIGSVFAFYRMVMAAGPTAIAFFVLGTGIFFGFGTFYSTIADGRTFEMFFDLLTQERYLAEINLLNATSTSVVLFTAWLLCARGVSGAPGLRGWREGAARVLQFLHRTWILIVFMAVAVLIMRVLTFPVPDNLILRGSLAKLQPITWLALLLGASRWRTTSPFEMMVVIALLCMESALGALALSKTDVMMPIVAFNAGLLLDKRSRWFSALTGVSVILGYFLLLAPLIQQGRYLLMRTEAPDTLEQRGIILSEVLRDQAPVDTRSASSTSALLSRFAAGPIQSYLIHEYQEGRPGESLSDFWIALVPRYLWPEKPEVTAVATRLYAKVFAAEETSALAPTYTAEAYWNLGWVGVVMVSVILGLELGWLSRMWLDFMGGQATRLGILVFAVPVLYMAFWVETWFVPTYVGGFVTLFLLIKLVNSFFVLPATRGSAVPFSRPATRL